MNPHTASLDEIRDWLARDDGWELFTASNTLTVWCRGGFMPEAGVPDYEQCPAHPYPPTIDGAASAMPKGWRIDYIRERDVDKPWFAQAVKRGWFVGDPSAPRACAEDDTMHGAIYRLAALARLAEKEPRP